jgi:hypothetical protein
LHRSRAAKTTAVHCYPMRLKSDKWRRPQLNKPSDKHLQPLPVQDSLTSQSAKPTIPLPRIHRYIHPVRCVPDLQSRNSTLLAINIFLKQEPLRQEVHRRWKPIRKWGTPQKPSRCPMLRSLQMQSGCCAAGGYKMPKGAVRVNSSPNRRCGMHALSERQNIASYRLTSPRLRALVLSEPGIFLLRFFPPSRSKIMPM